MPLNDWQFYVVTIAALAGLLRAVWPLLPRRQGAGGCPNCSAGSAATKTRKRVQLTVEQRRHI